MRAVHVYEQEDRNKSQFSCFYNFVTLIWKSGYMYIMGYRKLLILNIHRAVPLISGFKQRQVSHRQMPLQLAFDPSQPIDA